MSFEITNELLANITSYIEASNDKRIIALFEEMHYADVAEILDELTFDDVIYIIKLIDSEKTSAVLMELDEDIREKILQKLSAKEIAEEVEELDSDDAADIIGELSEERQEAVMSQIEDEEHVKEIEELLTYDEDSAGGLMAKELVKVNENWSVLKCVREMRLQAEEVTRVHSIYVVDDHEKLKGRLSLKDLLITSTKTVISEAYIPKVDFVNVHDNLDEVSNKMRKYDLEAIPVVDNDGILLGRITIDDVVDVIREQADHSLAVMAGLGDGDVFTTVLATAPQRAIWLAINLATAILAASVIAFYQDTIEKVVALAVLMPIVASMGGIAGTQSLTVLIRAMAMGQINDRTEIWLVRREIFVSIINGLIWAFVIAIIAAYWFDDTTLGLIIAFAIIINLITAGIAGASLPLILDRLRIDPALAGGVVLTTITDVVGFFAFLGVAAYFYN